MLVPWLGSWFRSAVCSRFWLIIVVRFPPELFADLFVSSTGRPSLPGEIAAWVLVLQTLQDLSERDAVAAVRCDIRWKLTLGLTRHTQAWILQHTPNRR